MKEEELDDTDKEILKILSKDGRRSHSGIAKDLDISAITVKRHIDELEEKEIIKNYSITINYEKLGYDFIALIELTISKGEMIKVEEQIGNEPNVFAVYDITGTYDAIILARFKTRHELNRLVKKINGYEYIVRTNTHLVLNIVKEGTIFTDLIAHNI